ncbi:MAG: ATP-binding protein [Cyclobacteriaceae bacterium]
MHSLEQSLQILDSLYSESDPGEITDIIASTRFHLAQGVPDSTVGNLSSSLAHVLQNNFQYDSALKYYRIALASYRKADDSLSVAHMLYNEATMLSELQEYVLSTDKYLQALDLYRILAAEADLADVYNALGTNYFYAGDETIALQNYDRALSYYQNKDDVQNVAMISMNMAAAFSQVENFDAAFIYYKEALGLLIGTEYTELLISTYHGIGGAKEQVGSYDDARYYYQRAYQLSLQFGRKDQLGYSYQNLGYYYLSQDQLDSALFYGQKAEQITKSMDQYLMRYNSYDLLHQIYSKIGEYEKAYDYLTMLKKEDDSTFSINKARQINIMLQEYELERAQNQVLTKGLEEAVVAQDSQKTLALRIFFTLVFITMLVIVILALRNERVKSKANKLLRQKNDEILEKNKQIQRIEEAKSRWFINVSHELRTPLSLVKGPIQQIARTEKFSKESLSMLNIANRNISHLEQLIREILDLSRLESGNIILHLEIFDLIEKVNHWLIPFQEVIEQQKLNVELQSYSLEKLFVKLDVNHFNKVFSNLLSNAIKFSAPEGKIIISLETNGCNLFLKVDDDGVGIPKKELPYVFDRFFQARNATQTEDSGTGVGLSISKEIIELHKGSISVESKLGNGTCVSVVIPEGVVDSHEMMDDKQKEVQTSYLTPKILLVEDNPDMQDFVHSFLDKRFDVIKEMNAYDALQSMEVQAPNLIITDLMMPKMDGFQFIQKVKENPKFASIPIIVTSAVSNEDKRLGLLRLGVNDYLVKPFNLEELVIKVENLIQNGPKAGKSAVSEMEEEEDLSFEDRFVKDLEEKVREYLSDSEFNVTKLAEEVSLSERQLYRYLRKTVKMTPATFIKEIRLSRAFELARRNVYATTAELSYAVGFQHPSYFTTVFKKRFGKKPSDFMKE